MRQAGPGAGTEKVMNIYIAGSSQEAAIVADYMQRLRAAGHIITFDWTVSVLAATEPDSELPYSERVRHAREDVSGVYACDLFWLLVPKTGSRGAWVELGVALGFRQSMLARRSIFVSGDYRASIFTSLADEFYETHKEAYNRISTARVT